MDDSIRISELLFDKQYDAAFNVMVTAYSRPLYQHIRTLVKGHEDADDVLQNTFAKIWRGLPNFRGESRISTWLFRIATNECYSFLKRTKRLESFEMHAIAAPLVSQAPISSEQIQDHLEKAIETLPPKQALVFKMRYFDEVPYEEMSEILTTSVGALKASYFHAVKKIERCFNNQLNL
jgi:RNA polymerase sigma-70 factor (ECF subfamily)